MDAAASKIVMLWPFYFFSFFSWNQDWNTPIRYPFLCNTTTNYANLACVPQENTV